MLECTFLTRELGKGQVSFPNWDGDRQWKAQMFMVRSEAAFEVSLCLPFVNDVACRDLETICYPYL